MAKGVSFKIDKRQLVKRQVHQVAAAALLDAGEHVLTEANTTVPHDEGTLERSGTVSASSGGLKVAVSYDTPYAVRQHEDTRLRHPGKGRAKWLERTFTEQRTRVGQFVADRIRKVVDS